jgi:hypothetical protein
MDQVAAPHDGLHLTRVSAGRAEYLSLSRVAGRTVGCLIVGVS